MREIKFKIWDWKKRKMLPRPQDIRMNLGTGEIHGKFSGGNVEEWIPLQFTGLKDKNNIEICEGDILKGRKGNNYKVVFENASFVCYHINSNYGRWGLLSRLFDADMKDLLEYIEVIGNIYENQDLVRNV